RLDRNPGHLQIGDPGQNLPPIDDMITEEEFISAETRRVALLLEVRSILVQERMEDGALGRMLRSQVELLDERKRIRLREPSARELRNDILHKIDHDGVSIRLECRGGSNDFLEEGDGLTGLDAAAVELIDDLFDRFETGTLPRH